MTFCLPAKRQAGGIDMNARKSKRKSLMMLAALVGIMVLGDGVGLVLHYGLTFRNAVAHSTPVTQDLTSRAVAVASTHVQ